MIAIKHCLRSNNAEQHANKGSLNYRISGLHVNTPDLIISLMWLLPGIGFPCVHCLVAAFSVADHVASSASRCQVPLWHWHALEVIMQMAPPALPPQQALANGSHTVQWQGRRPSVASNPGSRHWTGSQEVWRLSTAVSFSLLHVFLHT